MLLNLKPSFLGPFFFLFFSCGCFIWGLPTCTTAHHQVEEQDTALWKLWCCPTLYKWLLVTDWASYQQLFFCPVYLFVVVFAADCEANWPQGIITISLILELCQWGGNFCRWDHGMMRFKNVRGSTMSKWGQEWYYKTLWGHLQPPQIIISLLSSS